METTSGDATERQSPSPDSPSSASSSPSPSSASHGATLVSLVCIGILTYAWLLTDRFRAAPWWAAPAGIVLAAIPGGALAGTLSTVGRAAVDKIPSFRSRDRS